MNEPTLPEESLFLQALELGSAEEQAAFLDRECGTNTELRSSVEALIRHHREGSEFLESPPTEVVVAGEQLTAGENETPALDFLAPPSEPASIGRLEHYEILEVLGSGGFGVVLKARDAKLDRIVAVKTLAQSLASSATARRRFVREARAAAAVKHENVVGIYHVSDEGPVPYLVMECVSGVSLEAKLQQVGTLDLPAILRIGMQIASGLAAAHKQGLVHRDVKPGNILLENGVERVKITDFGLARAADDAAITKTGEVAGTPQYMSPEQAQGLPLDARSDLFSLGCVLYAMCTGRSPFRAETTVAVMRRVCDDTPRPIREVNSEVPPWLVAIIDRLLAKKPDERFQTAAEVADLLGQHLAELQHPSLPTAHAAAHPQSKIQNLKSKIGLRPWAIAAAALVLLILGISLTEATGVTQVVPTVIRIVTGEGTLVVETDPDVQVTMEGNGDLTFQLAGGQSIRVPTGDYRVKATKEGKPIPLDKELVTIARGDNQVVRVRLEREPHIAAAPNTEKGAFVLLGGKGFAERKFDTLAEAVVAASNGDTIEIRGNGPFVTSPITSGNLGLTLRAAARYRPIVQFSRDSGSHQSRLFASTASLTLEGLEFRGPPPGPNDDPVAFDAGISLHVANCRFLLPQAICFWSGDNTRRCVLRNCEFLGSVSALAGGLPPGGKWLVDNCVQLRNYALSYHPDHDNCSLQLSRCTCVGSADWDFPINLVDTRKLEPAQTPKVVQLSVSGCVLDCKNVLGANQEKPSRDNDTPLSPQDFATLLQELLKWSGGQNVYRVQGGPADRLLKTGMGSVLDPPHGPTDLAAWREFWRTPETGSLEGRVRYKGGNLVAKLEKTPHQLTPKDFRLRPDSAGYRAGPGGKDLGADVDLVGPGPAYEDWKKTPEYKEWLKESGQEK